MQSSASTVRSEKSDRFKNIKILKPLRQTIKELFETTTLHAYQYIVEPGRHWIERLMWICIQIIAVSSAIYILLDSWFSFTKNPTFTTLVSQQYPIWDLSYPAVSICSINKISRAAALDYANELVSRIPGVTETQMLNNIRFLGRLYDFDIENREAMIRFQDYLDQYATDQTTGFFDVEQVMRRLSPKCDNSILKCTWSGQLYNCSDLFEHRRTAEGFCCIFNYAHLRDNETIFTQKIVRQPSAIGPEQGLIVVVNASIDDYFYPLKNNKGFNIHIFNSYDYADGSTGSFHEETVGLSTEIFVRLGASTLKSESSVKDYTTKQRSCLFTDELYSQFGGRYSFSECLLKCKVRSIAALCKCVPFQFPMNFGTENAGSVVKCTLQHITCLNRYRIKWQTYKPDENVNTDGLEGELEDSLSCPDCLPLCTSTNYNVQSSSSRIMNKRKQLPRAEILNDLVDIQNLSVIRIFFPSPDSLLYKKDVIYTWYEILSNFGGMLGLCMGFSLISLLEILYYLTVRFYQNICSESGFTEKVQTVKKAPNMFNRKPPSYKEIEKSLAKNYDDKRIFYLK